MKKYVYIVVGGAALVVVAGLHWLVVKVRAPFVRMARRRRVDRTVAHYAPPEHAIRQRSSPSAEAAHRQFAVWG
jgi:hypothetical protein